jgi:hypothetical protein
MVTVRYHTVVIFDFLSSIPVRLLFLHTPISAQICEAEKHCFVAVDTCNFVIGDVVSPSRNHVSIASFS